MESHNDLCRKDLLKLSSSDFPAMGRGDTFQCSKPPSSLALNTARAGISTTSLGRKAQKTPRTIFLFPSSIFSLLSCQYRFQKMERLLIFQLLHSNAGKCSKQRKLIPRSSTASVDWPSLFQLSTTTKLTLVTGFVNPN